MNQATFVQIKLGHPEDGEMIEMTLPPDTGFEIRTLAVWLK